MKRCRKCKLEKPNEQMRTFKRDGTVRIDTICKLCQNEAKREWRKGRPPQIKTEADLKRSRDRKLLVKWGMTREEINERAIAQGGCLICGTLSPEGKGWAVDHDHLCCPGQSSCGKCICGILCARCNSAIGFLNDDPNLAMQAYTYLEQTRRKELS